MKISALISILLGFTFTFFTVSMIRGTFNWGLWIPLLVGGTIAYSGMSKS